MPLEFGVCYNLRAVTRARGEPTDLPMTEE